MNQLRQAGMNGSFSIPQARCPSDTGSDQVEIEGDFLERRTTYAGVTGDGMSDGFYASDTPAEHVYDGRSNTFSIGEQNSVPNDPLFVRPQFFERASCRNALNSTDESGLTGANDFGSQHTGGGQFLFLDGSVHFISQNIDLATYHALATTNGQEPVSGF